MDSLVDPASLCLLATAAATVYCGSLRAVAHERSCTDPTPIQAMNASRMEPPPPIMVTQGNALLLPVLCSVMLVMLFFFFGAISQFLLVFVSFGAAYSIVFAMQPLIENDRIVSFLVPRASHARLPTSVDCNPPAPVAHMGEQMSNPWAGRNAKLARAMRMLHIVLWSVSCTVVLSWLVTGSWLLNNVLGVAICVTCMAVIELPNVRICCILLGLLFVYDFFWVFLSEWIFGSNVMVSVATQESKNPMQTVAQALHVPKAEMIISSSLSLPMKLMFPRDLLQRIGNTLSILAGNSGSHTALTSGRRVDYSIIGLGDIALPGLLIALSRFLDLRERGSATAASSAAGMGARSRRGHVGYFVCSFFGYIVGLVVAQIMSRVYGPQPALIYLVPCTIIPILANARAHGELIEVWNHDARSCHGPDDGRGV